MAAVSAAAAVVGLGYSIYGGQKNFEAQQKARNMAQDAQAQARSAQGAAARVNREMMKRANQKRPDLSALLAEQQFLRPPATLLTGSPGLQLGL